MGLIKIKRGEVINLPTLEAGEPALCTDENGLYIGNGVENVKVGSKDSVDHLLDYTRNPAFALTTGTNVAYNITVTPTPVALLSGNVIIIIPHVDCGDNPTVTINNFDPIVLKHGNEVQILAGEMKEGHVYAFRYDTVDLLLEYTNDRRLSKDFISDFSIPDIQSGDGGKVLRVDDGEGGVYYADVASVHNYHGIESYGSFSFDDETQIFTVSSIKYWNRGVVFESVIPISCDINTYQTLTSNILYYIAFDDATGTLKAFTSMNLKTMCPVVMIFWNGSTGAVTKEPHNHTRDIDWHINSHLTIGASYQSGLSIITPTVSLPDSLELEWGVIFDEDIRLQLGDALNSVTDSRDWFKTSASAHTFTNPSTACPFVYNETVARTPHYLDTDTYTLEVVPDNEFVCTFIYATNDTDRPIYKVPTHRSSAHTTLNSALSEELPILNDVGLNNLAPEWKIIYRFIHNGSGEFITYIDYREVRGRPSGQIDPTALQNSSSGFSDGCDIGYNSASDILLYSGRIEVLGIGLHSHSNILVNFTTHALSGVTKQPNTWYFIFVEVDPLSPTEYIPFIDTYSPLKDSNGNLIEVGASISKYHNTRQARFRGSFRTDNNGNILRFIKTGNIYLYIGGYNYILQGGSATTRTAINCRSYVPLTSNIANVYYQLVTNNRDVVLGDSVGDFYSAQVGSGFVDIPVENNSIYYRVVSPGQVSLGIHGYKETN